MKNYRPNVAAVILAPSYPLECKILIAQRSDLKGVWQFPQGGIDGEETPKQAVLRELSEEIGTNDVEIIGEYPQWLSYDFPSGAVKKMYPYVGQNQKYFLVRLKGDAKIDIHTKHPEFSDYKFVNLDEIFVLVTHFKKPIYHKVLKYFKDEGYI